MNHDPMCPLDHDCVDGRYHTYNSGNDHQHCAICHRHCQCTLIATVRAEERALVIQAAADKLDRFPLEQVLRDPRDGRILATIAAPVHDWLADLAVQDAEESAFAIEDG